jgi:hypothetical protein
MRAGRERPLPSWHLPRGSSSVGILSCPFAASPRRGPLRAMQDDLAAAASRMALVKPVDTADLAKMIDSLPARPQDFDLRRF